MTEKTKISYRKIKTAGWNLSLLDGFAAKDAVDLISWIPVNPAHDGQRSNLEAVNASKFARVFKFDVNLSCRNYSMFLKIFLSRNIGDFLKHLIRPSRSARAFTAGIMLKENGLNAPTCILVGQNKFAGIIPVADFLITSEVAKSKQFHIILEELAVSDRNQKRKLLKQLGQTVGKMHAAGIIHGDLRLGNILVQKKTDDDFTFTLLDNERTRKFKRIPGKLRIKNLVQVNMFEKALSPTDRMRFYSEYIKVCNIEENQKRTLANAVIEKTSERLTAKRA